MPQQVKHLLPKPSGLSFISLTHKELEVIWIPHNTHSSPSLAINTFLKLL